MRWCWSHLASPTPRFARADRGEPVSGVTCVRLRDANWDIASPRAVPVGFCSPLESDKVYNVNTSTRNITSRSTQLVLCERLPCDVDGGGDGDRDDEAGNGGCAGGKGGAVAKTDNPP